MDIQFETMTSILLWLLLVDIVAATGDGVLLKDTEFQKITSSTLKWVPVTSPGWVPNDAVVGSQEFIPIEGGENDLSQITASQIEENKIYVCRAFVNGNWAPGALFNRTNVCAVPMVVRVLQIEQYEVLQNVDQAARLIWTDWEPHQTVPRGAISTGQYYVAHSASPKLNVLSKTLAVGMTFRMGKIDPEEGIFGRLSVVDEDRQLVKDVKIGRVLVEDEPVLYEVKITKLMEKRKKELLREARKLGEVTLSNDANRQMTADSVIMYKWMYSSNWGPGKAMLKGRPTTIYMVDPTQTTENITWGLPLEQEKDGVEKVETSLEAGTATHVTLEAIFRKYEVPYTGQLLSVFNDSHTMSRTIHGTWHYSALEEVKSVYGPLYFIHNNTLVPTTTTTTTTTTEAPITTTSAVTAPPTPVVQPADQRSTEVSTNDEHNNMLNDDDNNAMQLKKKEESAGGSAVRVLVSRHWIVSTGLLVGLLFGRIVKPIT